MPNIEISTKNARLMMLTPVGQNLCLSREVWPLSPPTLELTCGRHPSRVICQEVSGSNRRLMWIWFVAWGRPGLSEILMTRPRCIPVEVQAARVPLHLSSYRACGYVIKPFRVLTTCPQVCRSNRSHLATERRARPLGFVEVDPLAGDPLGGGAFGDFVQVDRCVSELAVHSLDEDCCPCIGRGHPSRYGYRHPAGIR